MMELDTALTYMQDLVNLHGQEDDKPAWNRVLWEIGEAYSVPEYHNALCKHTVSANWDFCPYCGEECQKPNDTLYIGG